MENLAESLNKFLEFNNFKILHTKEKFLINKQNKKLLLNMRTLIKPKKLILILKNKSKK